MNQSKNKSSKLKIETCRISLTKRNIEDVPFYKIIHEKDELPLEPAKKILCDKIDAFKNKYRILKKCEYDILTYEGENHEFNLPQTEMKIKESSFEQQKYFEILYDHIKEKSAVFEASKDIPQLYKERRAQLLQLPLGKKAPFYLNEFSNLYVGSSIKIEAIKNTKAIVISSSQFPASYSKNISYNSNISKIRSYTGIQEKCKTVEKKIKKFTDPTREMIRTRPSSENSMGLVYYSNVSKATLEQKRQRGLKPMTREIYMIHFKKQELKKLNYINQTFPVDPEEQKKNFLEQYSKSFKKANKLFTDMIQSKSKKYLKTINALEVETYPSSLVLRAFEQIKIRNDHIISRFLAFIKKEQISWPNILFEIILLDFLFNPINSIKEEKAIVIMSCLQHIEEDFKSHVQRFVLRYILKSKPERKRFNLELEPPEFPLASIRAPVPWKTILQIRKSQIDQVLMKNHPVIQALIRLWQELYSDAIIFDAGVVSQSFVPYDALSLGTIITNSCVFARKILIKDWLPRTADVLFLMKNTWEMLVPRNKTFGGRAKFLFECISALMSYQLQTFIQKSLKSLYKIIINFKEPQLIGASKGDNSKIISRPFITLNIAIIGKYYQEDFKFAENNLQIYQKDRGDPEIFQFSKSVETTKFEHPTTFIAENYGKFFIYPFIQELPKLISSYFKKILRVGYNIPRLESIISKSSEELRYLKFISEDHPNMIKLFEEIEKVVTYNLSGPATYLYPLYRYYLPLLSNKVKQIAEFILCQDTLPDLKLIEMVMVNLRCLLKQTYFLQNYIPLNLFMLDNRHVNEALREILKDIMCCIVYFYEILNANENQKICNEFDEMSAKAGECPTETFDVVVLQDFISYCTDIKIFILKDQMKIAAARVIFLLKYATLYTEDFHLNSSLFCWPSKVEKVLILSASRLNVVRESLEVSLREKRKQFEIYIKSHQNTMNLFCLRDSKEMLSLEELKEKCNTATVYIKILKNCSQEAKAINDEEAMLKLDQSFFLILVELIERMEPIEKLWRTAYDFEKNYQFWFYGPFAKLKSEGIQDQIAEMSKTMIKVLKDLKKTPCAKKSAEQIHQKIDKFKIYLPVIKAVCSNGMAAHHWSTISEKLGRACSPELNPTVKSLIDIGIMSILEVVETVAYSATKEYELTSQLIEMQEEWKNVAFEVLPYRDSKDAFILASINDIQTLLDDHTLKIQAMRASPQIVAIEKEADKWEHKLFSMQDILDLWIQVQTAWMYLEPIFSSEDILRQMPVEGKNFKSVDKIWRKIMLNTAMNLNVLNATDYPKLFELLRKSIDDLELVQKGLNSYLEKKRLFFARFFFLSNDEMLEILSETKDPTRVQPHLRKCFEGINSLVFNDKTEILAMISAEEERISLVKKIYPLKANGLVELWLKEVQNIMFATVHEQLWKAWKDYFISRRYDWVQFWPGQIVQAISCTAWTSEVEEAIEEVDGLSVYLEKCQNQIIELVNLVREDISFGTRIKIEALIVLDVHARDTVKFLADQNVRNVTEFNWLSQLRYYWKPEEQGLADHLYVNMVETNVLYGLEYLGNLPRLVVTPLTDRCYRTLLGAIQLCLGGAPEGPAGTGKTETCKDLAKAVAKKCVVFNCSDSLDYKALGKFFKGLAQSGSWACFDEFNRIELEVLSVVAQQILTIQRAIAQKLVKFYFEETWLRLDLTCTVFITMNPGYAGRSALPDNLKVLFRTVAMMVPDYAMIGEITLYSNGFIHANQLAQKIVHTYKLCSEQLSSQSHYDYGMRAVKSVLLAASSLRRAHPDFEEAQIVLRAIIDLNLPKFLEQDISLFEGIFHDLFPGVRCPTTQRDELINWIKTKLTENNCQATPWFMEKVMQAFEMLLVRHGVMIVGGTMAGKTTAYQILAEALRSLSGDVDATSTEYFVNFRIINPKALTTGQLYGSFDPLSHEWSDGVLAKTFREYAYSSKEDRFWIVFDGPVDAVWIENLNTVLDDNKILCLMSGEIIRMSNKMNMMFETVDLEQASPATVSRCGMIYMEPFKLGWEVNHKSFINELEKMEMSEINVNLFEALCAWLIPPALEFAEKSKVILVTSPTYKYNIFSKLFSYFINKTEKYSELWLQQVFLFCLVWGIGSTFTNDGKKYFDLEIRKVLYGNNATYPKTKYFSLSRGQIFPEKLSVFDYYFDGTEKWLPWLKSNDIDLPMEARLSELSVPTMESERISYWLEVTFKQSLPTLLIGPTGTGKSLVLMNYLNKMAKKQNLINIINFSARTTAQQVQDTVVSKLDKRRKGLFGPPLGQKCLIMCDDLGMPSRDAYGSQPPLELVRQWLDHSCWFDLKDFSNLELIDLLFVGGMGTLGGSSFIYPRLYRHMLIIAVDSFEASTIVQIFSILSKWHFGKGYSDEIKNLVPGLAEALVQVYQNALHQFLPTPAKSHYTFSLRDVTRTFEGITMVPATHIAEPEKLVRLWIHETYRVYDDRLIDNNDRNQLFAAVANIAKNTLRLPLYKAIIDFDEDEGIQNLQNILFGNYMEPDVQPKVYDEVDSYSKLEKVMCYYLKEYNTHSSSSMNLVLFRFAIEHLSRISRVLQMARGNMLLVGLGGSGRRSLAKLATSIAEADLLSIDVTKTYSVQDWHDDIKKLLMKAGLGMKPIVFLFDDSQANQEIFMEDLNTLLSTGELLNLFQYDEKMTIIESMQAILKKMGKRVDMSPVSLYRNFIERVRENLHFVLVFSPIGESFKCILRMYPSFVNCCTVNWFTTWPEAALEDVATSVIPSIGLNQIIDDDEEALSNNKEMLYERPLSSIEINEEVKVPTKLEKGLIRVAIYLNKSIEQASAKYYEENNRKNYVLPKSYLDMLDMFKTLYNAKFNEIIFQRDRYKNGLIKLEIAAEQVAIMQINLHALRPQLEMIAKETDQIMVSIEQDTADAEKRKEIVGADEAAANEAAAAAQAIKDDCESDLAEAVPALEAALDALNTLKPADITVLKSMKTPPAAVKLVMEAVCVLKGIKPDRKPDPGGAGMIEDYWGPSQKMLGDFKFLDSLKTFDRDTIPPAVIKRIRDKYIQDRDFIPEKIKNVSAACEGLCKWVRAVDIYDRVSKIVAPKKLALEKAENELATQMETLNSKRAELQRILDKLQKLNDFFAEKCRQKKELEDEIIMCGKKLDRAETLLGSLGGEKTRWSDSARILQESIKNIVGDVLLGAGSIAYLGFFTADYRTKILKDWNFQCTENQIACTENFSLINTLGNSIETQAWLLAGLPSDNFSIENGIIVKTAKRYPLMIDPQEQGNKWVKNMEQKHGLKVIKQTDKNYMRVLELAIKWGNPVLLENVDEDLDFNLSPILEKSLVHQHGLAFLKCGDHFIEYNENFRFYITTCLKNPHYPPQTLVMVTILNFMITEQGLREQLLTTVVTNERPDLQEKKEQLIVESAKNSDSLYNIESEILEVLSSEGNILEDENAINILSSSKILSIEIQEKQMIAKKTEYEIDFARQEYYLVARHSAVLFFCISELSNINPMYQYSLIWFLSLFINCIKKAEQSNVLSERLENLINSFTQSLYTSVCRSLFDKDKLVFSLAMCINMQISKEEINKIHLMFFLTGTSGIDNPYPNPAPEWLTQRSWGELVEASKLKGLEMFLKSFVIKIDEWKEIYYHPNPEKVMLPTPYEQTNEMIKLIILKCLRPDKVVSAVRIYVSNEIGNFYVEPSTFNLAISFEESDSYTPLIFLLSAGSDPIANLLAFAKARNMQNKMRLISLGQGQGPKAEKMICEGIVLGQWIVLQNCHLVNKWMQDLERICLEVTLKEKIHPDYRLWCTSYPSNRFPVSILQSSVKMTTEPPKGLKMNLLQSFNSDPLNSKKFFHSKFSGKNLQLWQRGVFALAFFHAVIQERREFGPLGWNIPYEFNESDLKISLLQLRMFIKQYNFIPFEGHTYLTGECNYGGRVTDDKDRRLLTCLLKRIYNENAVEEPNYSLSASGNYRIPVAINREQTLEYISTFSVVAHPEVFGLHENADINKNSKETYTLLASTANTQEELTMSTKATSHNLESVIETEISFAQEILNRLPSIFDVKEISEKYPVLYTNSMNTVLRQEIIRFNNLLSYIRTSLTNVDKAIKGVIAMIPALEKTLNSLNIGNVPADWLSKSYPSLKPLGSYINDLLARLSHLRNWVDNGEPIVYWISGFYFTQSFITGVLQNFARKNSYGIDLVTIAFEVTEVKATPTEASISGVYVKGLYVEGARWNRQIQALDESFPKILFDVMPIILMKPILKSNIVVNILQNYSAPIYKTSFRQGILSTTGHSTNFVMCIDLRTLVQPTHWILRGVACLTQLDD